MPAPLPVLINPHGGKAAALGDRLEETVRSAFAGSGREICLEVVTGIDLATAIRSYRNSPVVAVGGGDGTFRIAAQALAGTRAALAMLPLGSCNRLARELGVPLHLDEAAAVAATGERRRMDLGRAGRRVFLTSASVGIPPDPADPPERSRRLSRPSKLNAALHVLRTMRPQRYRLAVGGSPRTLRTPLLCVGNSRYSLDPESQADREPPADAELSLGAVRAQSRLQLGWFAFKVLIGLARPEADFEDLAEAATMTIEGTGQVGVALDGEVERMGLPLQFDILPSALGVVAPRVPARREQVFSRTH